MWRRKRSVLEVQEGASLAALLAVMPFFFFFFFFFFLFLFFFSPIVAR